MNNICTSDLRKEDISTVLHPNTNARTHIEVGPSILERGEGLYAWDTEGRKFFDSGAGLWCTSLGFSNERIAQVAYDNLKQLGYCSLFKHQSNPPAIELSRLLLEMAPAPMSKVMLQCSGSEANDTAVKLAWYYWQAKGQPKRRKIIGRKGSYHGSTVVATSITENSVFHSGYGLPLAGFIHTDCPNFYRYGLEGETQQQFVDRLSGNLEKLILDEGPDTIAAMFADPVQGSAGGLKPPLGYFEKISAVLRKYDILLVADEVICGFGRTGNMWGSQTYNIQPDMITCAKALSAGFYPISALMINDRVYQSILDHGDKLGSFVHGYTYGGHPVAAAVAIETLKIYEDMDIVKHVKALEPVFVDGLKALMDHPLVGEANGCGLVGGLEIVADKKSKTYYPHKARLPAIVDRCARREGLLVRFVTDRMTFSPSFIITEEQITDMFARARRTLDSVSKELE